MAPAWADLLVSAIGTPVVLAIAGYVAWLLRERIRQSIGHSFNIGLEQFKNDIGKQTSQQLAMQSTANAVLVETQRLSAERRLKALDAVWYEIQGLRSLTSGGLAMLDIVASSDDYQLLLRNYNLHSSYSEMIGSSVSIHTTFDKERPFVGEKIYALCNGYRALILYLMTLLSDIKHGSRTNQWRHDHSALALVHGLLDADEMKDFDRSSGVQATMMTIRIEEKILQNIRSVIAGTQSVEDGVEMASQILKLTVAVTQESRRDHLSRA